MALPFPDLPWLNGFEEPCRFEGRVHDLTVHGTIPKSIDGTFFRVMPDPLLSPAYFQDGTHFIPFDGDGNVSAFRIHDGHVDFQQQYVQTERFVREKKERKSLWGRYRNPFTYHPCVRTAIETTANTNIVFFNGKLLACKENGLPYAMDPKTLETLGYYDFEGQITSKTFTAHPKMDPLTGEMVCWGYEAKGNGTTDCCYFAFGKDGKKTEECWFTAPYCGFIHDAFLTHDYIVMMMCPLVTSNERLEKGETHWEYDYKLPVTFGVVPRRGSDGSKVKWFKWKNGFPPHTGNATQYRDPQTGNTKLVLDAVLGYGNLLPFFPATNTPETLKPGGLKINLVRWEIDLDADKTTETMRDPSILADHSVEFPRVDDRFVGRAQRYIFCGIMVPADESLGKSLVGQGALNALAKVDCVNGKVEVCRVGPQTAVQEPVFVPRSDDPNLEEGDGYLIGLVNRLDKMRSDLVVVDTKKMEEGPIAVVNLPFRLRQGLHGNWVPASDMA